MRLRLISGNANHSHMRLRSLQTKYQNITNKRKTSKISTTNKNHYTVRQKLNKGRQQMLSKRLWSNSLRGWTLTNSSTTSSMSTLWALMNAH